MKFEGYCSIEQAECQNGKTIGQKAGNKRLKAENNQNGVLGLQVTKSDNKSHITKKEMEVTG